AVGDAVRHVHLKDEVPPKEGAPPVPWTPVLMGRGEFPAEAVLDALVARGYQGFVSFEWEKRWHPEIEEPEGALPHFIRYVSQGRRGERSGVSSRTRSSASSRAPGRRPSSSPPPRRRTSSWPSCARTPGSTGRA